MTNPGEDIPPLWPDDQKIGYTDGPIFEMADGRRYVIARTLATIQPDVTQKHRVAISNYIRQHAPGALPIAITTHNIENIAATSKVPTKEKAWRLLKEIVRELDGKPGELKFQFSPHVPGYLDRIRRIGVDMGTEELALLDYLEATGYIQQQRFIDNTTKVTLPVSGLVRFEELSETTESSNAFVAMWFNPELDGVYDEAIAPALDECGFNPVRIDKREHNNKIDDEIIAEVRRAKFVVADFSCGEDGARGGVYYEAGYAAGIGKPVIFCVREDDLDRVHFDTRQYNHIVWTDAEDLRIKLINRIGATLTGA